MKRRISLFALSLSVLAGVYFASTAYAARQPLVLAFYYIWFDENTWKPDKVPDMPATKYASRDPGTMARHIQQAKSAGIDALVVSWWGTGNPTEDNIKVMFDQAAAANFKIAIDFELTSPFFKSKNDVIRNLRHLIDTHTKRSSYLRVEGKPVIFFWRQQMYSVDEWKAIRDAVDPNHQTLWIDEGLDVSYLRVFDGHHLYMVAWAKNAQAELSKWPPRIRQFGADKIWVATVNPGANNSKTTQSEKVVRDRQNGEYYRETWRAAFSTYPDWIVITSWNEWPEGTMIEPSVTYGNLYLDITREFAAQFKAGLPTPTPTNTRTPTPTRTATPLVTATVAVSAPVPETGGVNGEIMGVSAIVTDTIRVRSDPNNNAAVLGRLREGATVELLAISHDSNWWQIAFPNEKSRGWIAAEFVKTDDDTSGLPMIVPAELMPTATATATPTRKGAKAEPTATATATATVAPTEIPTKEPSPESPPTKLPTPAPAATATATPPSLLKRLLPFLP